MSRPASNEDLGGRRRKRRPGSRGPQGWGPVQEVAWAGPPSPRRSRWEEPGPAGWGPEGPPAEGEAGPGPFAPWGRPQPTGWGGRPRNRPAGEPWDSPPRDAAWEHGESGGGLGQPRGQWGPGLGGGRWSSPERTRGGGRRRTPSPRQGAWDSPEAPRRQQGPNGDTWGNPGREGSWELSRNVEGPAWEQRQGSPGGPGGRWGSAGRRKEERESPSRERRSMGSSGRDGRQDRHRARWSQPSREQTEDSSNGTGGRGDRTERRGRVHPSPTRKQSGWGSPQREARQAHWGSTRHHAREQGQINPDEGGSRQRSSRSRERNRARAEGSLDGLEEEWQNPNGEARGQGSPVRSRGVENLDEGGAERDSHKKGGEEKGTYAAGSSSPNVSTSLTNLISGSSAIPKEWTPCESVVQWWMQCRSIVQNNKTREQLISMCPRPVLPDRSSETPEVNPDLLSLLNKQQEKQLRSARYFSRMVQDEVLDMLGPAMTIYEMAEEAMEKAEPVDPMELREWSRHLIRFIGSINQRLTLQHRHQVLGSINPRLKVVVSKMSGQSNEGMLFAEDKVRLLKEIIMRFPQLSETKNKVPGKRFYPFARPAFYGQAQRRPFLGPGSKPLRTRRRGTARQRVDTARAPEGRAQPSGTEGPSGACGGVAPASRRF